MKHNTRVTRDEFYHRVCGISDGKFGLYPVVTEKFCAGRSSEDVLKEIVRSGKIRIVQLREKEKTDGEIYRTALVFRRITKENGIILIVNDRLDIALAVGADGIHLGQDDLPLRAAKKILRLAGRNNFIIGVSTHSLDEALEAQRAGATYINIGPIFPTKTKETSQIKPLGVEAIKKISQHIKIPFTVMGGIKEENISLVASKGARVFAMVTEITSNPHIVSKVRSICRRIEKRAV